MNCSLFSASSMTLSNTSVSLIKVSCCIRRFSLLRWNGSDRHLNMIVCLSMSISHRLVEREFLNRLTSSLHSVVMIRSTIVMSTRWIRVENMEIASFSSMNQFRQAHEMTTSCNALYSSITSMNWPMIDFLPSENCSFVRSYATYLSLCTNGGRRRNGRSWSSTICQSSLSLLWFPVMSNAIVFSHDSLHLI